MRKKAVFVVNDVVHLKKNPTKMEVDLEQALEFVGAGRYQIFHCTLMLATLTSTLLEMIGNAFILPAAACDLDLPDSLRGILTSIPNIGIILTAPFWGRAADTHGRKPVLLLSLAGAGTLALVAALMPNLITFALCKFAASLFFSCPSSLGYAYAGELLPHRRRDLAVLALNGLLMLSSSFSSLLAWGILSADWEYFLGSITLRPWRLLTAVYAIPLVLTALWMTQTKESPKYLMAKGRSHEALEVLKHIYAFNTRLPPDSYCVTSLRQTSEESQVEENTGSGLELTPKETDSALSLLRPPHVKWLALTSFLMFGLFSLLNGLFLFSADTINKVMNGSSDENGTICILLGHSENNTNTTACVDTISHETFLVMVSTTAVYGALVMVVSLCPISKKTMLISMFSLVGVACLLSGVLKNRMVAGMCMLALQLTALGIGPLTAYAVELFPTNLRGTAVGAVLMFGRLGSVVGANAAGIFLAAACTATFYGFTVLLLLCAALSVLLPQDQSSTTPQHLDNNDR